MKKILFAAFSATLLVAGCQKTEIIGFDNGQTGPAMTFSTEMKKITKTDEAPSAGATGLNDNLYAQGFKIWAYADYDLTNATNVENLLYDGLNGTLVTHGTNGWTTTTDYYWPGTDKPLRFFALSSDFTLSDTNPYQIKVNHGISNDVPSIEISNFKVTDGNDDLMVADFRKQHQNQDQKKVILNFHHALSKIEFKFKTTIPTDGEASNVYVKKLTVSNLNTTGSLDVTPIDENKFSAPLTNLNAEELDVEFKWKGLSTLETFVGTWDVSLPETHKFSDATPDAIIDLNGQSVEVTDEYKNVLLLDSEAETFATWLMIPQTITADNQLIVVEYIIKDRLFEAKFPLGGKKTGDAYQLSNWDDNQYVTYTIDLSPNLISFNATAVPWAPYDGDGDKNVGDAENNDGKEEGTDDGRDDDIHLQN